MKVMKEKILSYILMRIYKHYRIKFLQTFTVRNINKINHCKNLYPSLFHQRKDCFLKILERAKSNKKILRLPNDLVVALLTFLTRVYMFIY